MQLPKELIEGLEATKGFDRSAFEQVHASGEQVTSIRINPSKVANIATLPLPRVELQPVPWSAYGYYLSKRPSFTFDPLFHAGCYYVQEASSMFLEQVLRQSIDLSQPLRVLDLCAAPGGKSTHIQSLISSDSLLVSNDVIRSRANVLKDNMIKWGCENVMVTNNDPRDFTKLEGFFDVIVVDAPCSGSGLFRRDENAISEWSVSNVELCSQRQQRILSDILPALNNGGLLVYATCSYSKEEDEDILDWIVENGPDLSPMEIDLSGNDFSGIIETLSSKGATGYRFWPDKIKGEGFFISCFKKEGTKKSIALISKMELPVLSKAERLITCNWIADKNQHFLKYENTVYAWPSALKQDMNFIWEKLKVIYSGIRVGQLMRDKLVPDHALAMSNNTKNADSGVPLAYEEAIKYLQRKEIHPSTDAKGWQLIKYEGYTLGWINILHNRINNYYPKELRILKERETG